MPHSGVGRDESQLDTCGQRGIEGLGPTRMITLKWEGEEKLKTGESESTGKAGALHGTEMIYLFSPTAYRQVFNSQLNYNEETISDNMKKIVYLRKQWKHSGNGKLDSLVHFNPNSSSSFHKRKPELTQYAPKWEKYTPQTPRYASLKSNQIHQGYQHHLIAFWNNLLPELGAMVLGRTSPGGSTVYPPIPTGSNPSFTDTQSKFTLGKPSPESGITLCEMRFAVRFQFMWVWQFQGIVQVSLTDQPVQYQSAVWVLVAIILLLVGVIAACIVCT
ncbi:uncharacterized protein [Macrobrachium rosenbergii]|uniref:uncharacterized protein n=1 Tax=Macrobrachium rosenbergii TaxID=79674 RepID=UPI0034D3D006